MEYLNHCYEWGKKKFVWVILLPYDFALVVQTNQIQFKHSMNVRAVAFAMPHITTAWSAD